MSVITTGKLHTIDITGFDEQSICLSIVFQNQCSLSQRWTITTASKCKTKLKGVRSKWMDMHANLAPDDFYTAVSSLCSQTSGPVLSHTTCDEVAVEGFSDVLKNVSKIFSTRPKFNDEELFGKYSVRQDELVKLLNNTVLRSGWMDDCEVKTGTFDNLAAINMLDYKGRIGKDGVLATVHAGIEQYRKVMTPYYKKFLHHAETVEEIHNVAVKAVTGDEDGDEVILVKAIKDIKALPSVLKTFSKTELMGNVEVFADKNSLESRDLKVKQQPIPLLTKEEVVDVAKLIITILGDKSLEAPFMPYPDYDTEPEFWQSTHDCHSSDEYASVTYFQRYYDWDLPYGVSIPDYSVIDALAKLLIASIKK